MGGGGGGGGLEPSMESQMAAGPMVKYYPKHLAAEQDFNTSHIRSDIH